MRHFVINVEETIGKTVGRRVAGDPLRIRPGEIQQAEAWRRRFGGVRIPKGVFRFSSHKEADAWLMTKLAENGMI